MPDELKQQIHMNLKPNADIFKKYLYRYFLFPDTGVFGILKGL